jgi:hypothetical protein
MDISNYISTLLQLNECVVIPDFGAFISSYVPARYDANEGKYYPPAKEIVFNPKIVKNDGLLQNHLVENEGIGYQQARDAIQTFYDQSLARLNDGEKILFKNLGSLEFDRFGSFVFTAEKVNLLADAYGLKPFNPVAVEEPFKLKTYTERPAVRAISHRGNAIKIAASIALVLSLSLIPMKINRLITTSDVNPVWNMVVEKPAEPAPEQKTETPSEETKAPEAPSTSNKRYVLVGGTFALHENAVKFYNQLEEKGLHPELYQKEDGQFRVIIDSYNDWNEALVAMTKFRDDHPNSQVWVSKR